MLKTKLFQAFAALAIVFGLLSSVIGIQIIRKRVMGEAQNQVSLDIGSAWAIFNSKLHDLETVLDLVAIKKIVVDAASEHDWASEDIQQRLETIRTSFGLDFLTVVSPEGQVVLRAAPPYRTGDFQKQNPVVLRALKGEHASGVTLMSQPELDLEAEGLSEKAFLVLEKTPRARATPLTEESRGMVLATGVPIFKGPQLLGAVYAGVLLNRNQDLVDRMTEVIYKNEQYKGLAMGTATIFLKDCRVATTVRLPNGNRAIGTRVSKEVADRVLDNGLPWIGPAFVVKEPYLTAYDPIRGFDGEVIGMLYVGRLERPFKALSRNIMMRYAGLSVFGLAAALVLAFIMAGRLANPIHRLVEASQRMRKGEPHTPVECRSSCGEIENLVVAFNEMATALEEREGRLKEANEKLEKTNEAVSALNLSYMDMLGFVSHELKSPVASIMNYVFLLRQQKLGPLTPGQEKAARNIETNSKRIVEMVRHYLNLSRIETGELRPVPTRVAVADEVVRPLLEASEGDAQARRMRVESRIGDDLRLKTDLNMTREVFENLVSNAIKYGRDDGLLQLDAQRRDGFVEFSVFNEGAGIPRDKIETVFQKFTRLEEADGTRHQKGTGLGLFITRHIVEAHGGRIQVESEPGQWVRFRFTLPVFPEQEKA
ncbi:MAG TPA: cache domain-containing protein [Kiritimatiellia bacterium]|nr:cache domain-containing protein [Kiritimatiellia bacterium]HSA18646.1 cache domain-containing protein [Kiritimatiellia bacterium]